MLNVLNFYSDVGGIVLGMWVDHLSLTHPVPYLLLHKGREHVEHCLEYGSVVVVEEVLPADRDSSLWIEFNN